MEVCACLPGRSVFLAGETLECHVTFSNIRKIKSGGSPERMRPAKLAWSSAQIHCQCTVSEARVKLPKARHLTSSDVSTTGNETAFVPSKGERGETIWCSTPNILFCDLSLLPGQSHTVVYKEKIPLESPPSFRGSSVKYSYKITIGCQRFDHATRLVRVPFRVLVVPGLHDLTVYSSQKDSLKPSNPFQHKVEMEDSLLDVAMEVLQTVTCRKGPNFYNITNSKGRVCRFCLFKQAYRIGDDIVGTVDFSQATIPCVQFSVTLHSEEVISNECCKKPNLSTTVTSFSKHTEFCLHTKKTHISIPIPLTATPGFTSEPVKLNWKLHFEFVTTKSPIPDDLDTDLLHVNSDGSHDQIWQGPAQLQVETMIWDMPLKVFATNPLHATSVSLLKSENTCVL